MRIPPFKLLVIAVVPWFLCTLSAAGTDATAGPLPPPVVGGRAVEPGEWPDVVAVLTAGGGLCSGTLLAADLVVTAAHCIEAQPVEVIVGSVDLAMPDGQRRRVKAVHAYPNWTESYDVGIVMLENPVFAKHRAIALGCGSHRVVKGTPLEVVGFGLTSPAATDDNTVLHKATVAVSDPTCTSNLACEPSVAPGGELIAGGDGRDACFGDSGGPAFIWTASGPALLGIVSRGLFAAARPCGDGGVFVRADKVVRWIESVSGRTVERAACDAPADGPYDDDGDGAGETMEPGTTDMRRPEHGGCDVSGGDLPSMLTIGCALLCIAGMGRSRRDTTRSAWPRSR